MRYFLKKNHQICLAVAIAITLSGCGGSSENNETTKTVTPIEPEKIVCVNGIPQNLKTKGNGIFSEEVFVLELANNDNDRTVLAFNSNTLSNGVLYSNVTNYLKNSPTKIETQYLPQYYLTHQKLDTSFKQTQTSRGFPEGYVISQEGDYIVLNQFSDECTIQAENQIKTHIKQIDISGKTIADLFKYYDYPNNGNAERYISSDIANFLEYNDNDSLSKLLLDQTKFPTGSKISYIDQSISNASHITFNGNDLTDYKTIDEFKTNTKLPEGYIWKDDQFAGYKIAYPVSTSNGISYPFTQNYTAVILNDKIYSANYFPEGDLIQQQKQPKETDLQISETYFNKTSMLTIVEALNKVL